LSVAVSSVPIPVPAQAPVAPRFRLGTRGSALAVAQSTTIADALRALGAEVELVTIRTVGDDRPPDTTWGEGAFVGALEAALLSGEVDLAVHSAKDVPTTEHPKLAIAAYPERADPRDAIVGREPGTTLEGLPRGARVGTDSPRRGAFLRVVRPDLRIHPLHGNVDTRLRRLDEGATDALILAVAGLARLERADRIGQILPAEVMPPAPGQGSLAIQCRADDEVTRAWLTRLDDPATRAAVEAERGFLVATGGGCRAPIGVLARVEGDVITLRAGTAGIDGPEAPEGTGPTVAWGEVRGPVADRMTLAADLASRLTAELAGGHGPPTTSDLPGGTPRVLVTRPAAQAASLAAALVARGLDAVVIPTIEILPVEDSGELDRAILAADATTWIAVTSMNGGTALLGAAARLGTDLSRARWAAVGPATKAMLEARGMRVAFLPSVADAQALAAELPIEPGDEVLAPRADIADGRLVGDLMARGARVLDLAAYRTLEAPEAAREQLRALFAGGGPDAIVFTSGSTVRGLLALLASAHQRMARRTPACCIGEATAAVARTAGFARVVVAATPNSVGIADLIKDALLPGRLHPAPEGREEDPS
jgi:hydroxymethylbilane synthase